MVWNGTALLKDIYILLLLLGTKVIYKPTVHFKMMDLTWTLFWISCPSITDHRCFVTAVCPLMFEFCYIEDASWILLCLCCYHILFWELSAALDWLLHHNCLNFFFSISWVQKRKDTFWLKPCSSHYRWGEKKTDVLSISWKATKDRHFAIMCVTKYKCYYPIQCCGLSYR